MEEHVVIIGNGIAGITAARHIRRISEKRITVISSENEYFFSRTALMYVYMGHMKWEHLEPYEKFFWKKNRIQLRKEYVEEIRPENKTVLFAGGGSLSYDSLIIATGSVPRRLNCKGEDLKGVQGLVSKQDLELLEENTVNCRKAVIVGGGLIGVELAEMLHSRKIPVSIVIREESFWRNVLPEKDSRLVSRHIVSHGVDILTETEVKEISGERKVEIIHTNKGDSIQTDLVGMTIGVAPQIQFLKKSGIETDQGVLVNASLETNVKDVFAIGDCAQLRNPPKGRKPIEAVWYTARMMGETVAQTICGNPFQYKPGNWFNSAKFFEIEFQTYGQVSADPTFPEQHLHWEDSSGKKAITIAYDNENSHFLGINTFGIRMRHQVIDRWLTENKTLDYVMNHLKDAHFDPEFYNDHFNEIVNSFKKSITSA